MKVKQILIFPFLLFSLLVACGNNAETKNPVQQNSETKHHITSKEALKLLEKNKSIVILDVRTPREFSQGHIKGAINIDVTNRDFVANVKKINKPNQIYLVHCRTHNRSKVAIKYMLANGFVAKNIYQMMDGFSGWSANGLPIEK